MFGGKAMLLDFNNPKINRPAQTAEFGIERESLRVTSDGKLSQTKHPFFGDPHIDRDFCISVKTRWR